MNSYWHVFHYFDDFISLSKKKKYTQFEYTQDAAALK